MAMNPQMGAQAMAGGMPPQQGMPPQGAPPQQGAPSGQMDVQAIIEALKQALPQVTDPKGYVDVAKLIMLWPQLSPDIPFQVVMQLIEQNPDILTDIIAQFGLAGIIANNRVVSADELAALGGRGAQ